MVLLLNSVAKTLTEGVKRLNEHLIRPGFENASDSIVTIQPRVCIKISKDCNFLPVEWNQQKNPLYPQLFEAHAISYLKHLARA